MNTWGSENGERSGCKKWQRHISWFADHIDHKPSETLWFSHRELDTNTQRVAIWCGHKPEHLESERQEDNKVLVKKEKNIQDAS